MKRYCSGAAVWLEHVDSLRRINGGIGAGVGPVRVRRYSGAGMARIAGEERWGRMWPRWAVAPLGFRQLR